MKSMKGNVQYDSKGITATQSIHLSISSSHPGHFGWTTGGQCFTIGRCTFKNNRQQLFSIASLRGNTSYQTCRHYLYFIVIIRGEGKKDSLNEFHLILLRFLNRFFDS